MDALDVRPARPDDGPRLSQIDAATWSPSVSPAPVPDDVATRPFFSDTTPLEDVLVAVLADRPVGYLRLGPPTPVPSNAHVLMVLGFAVDPEIQGRGVGRRLLDGAKAEARARGAAKLRLNVLGHNDTARLLYAKAGFHVEGVLHQEFVIGGAPIDDLLLACALDGDDDRGRTYDADATSDVPEDVVEPIGLVSQWFAAAETAGERQPRATVLSTVGGDGRPSSRAVLVGDIGPAGFVFHTNRDSRKGRELVSQPFAAMCSVWNLLHRQVRIEGRVEPAPEQISDDYWSGRPVGSQVSAAASPQSQVVPDRAWLDAEVARVAAEHPESVPRPGHWGGYLLVPDVVEFWAGRRNRLHDRTRFTREVDGQWRRERLAP